MAVLNRGFAVVFLLVVTVVVSSVARSSDASCKNSKVILKNKHSLVLYMSFENVTSPYLRKGEPDGFQVGSRFVNVKVSKAGKCGNAVNLTNGHMEIIPSKGQQKFRDVSVALWVKPNKLPGKQTLIRLLGRGGLARHRTRYAVELYDGFVQWGCWRGRNKIFQIKTNRSNTISPHVWTHIKATFNTRSHAATVYINGTLALHGLARNSKLDYWPVTWLKRIEIGSAAARRRLRGAVDELFVWRIAEPVNPTTGADYNKYLTAPDTDHVTFASDGRQEQELVKEHKLRCYVCKAFNQSKPQEYCAPNGGHASKTVCHGVTPLKCIEHSWIDKGTSFFIRDCKEDTFCEARSCTGDLCTMKCCERDFCNYASHRVPGSLVSLLIPSILSVLVMRV